MKHLGLYIAIAVVLVILIGWYLFMRYETVDITSLTIISIGNDGTITFTGTVPTRSTSSATLWPNKTLKIHIASLGSEIATTVLSATASSSTATQYTFVTATKAIASPSSAQTTTPPTTTSSDYVRIFLK